MPIGASPTYDISLRLYDTARKRTFPRRDILALEFFGPPPPYRCAICDKLLQTDVLHLNKNPRDFSRGNLKYGGDFLARTHVIDCVNWAMRHNEVPPRVKTTRGFNGVVRRSNSMPKRGWAKAARRKLEDNWGPTWEEIPLLGVNERPRGTTKK